MKASFAEYPEMLIKLFNSMMQDNLPGEEPTPFYLHMELRLDNTAELEFRKRLEFKEVTMLTCQFEPETEDVVKMHIRHRHNIAKLEME